MDTALGLADFSDVTAPAIDETARARGHDYVRLPADAVKRRVLFVTAERDAKTIEALASCLDEHWCSCVMRSRVAPLKDVATLVRRHLEGIVAWAQTR